MVIRLVNRTSLAPRVAEAEAKRDSRKATVEIQHFIPLRLWSRWIFFTLLQSAALFLALYFGAKIENYFSLSNPSSIDGERNHEIHFFARQSMQSPAVKKSKIFRSENAANSRRLFSHQKYDRCRIRFCTHEIKFFPTVGIYLAGEEKELSLSRRLSLSVSRYFIYTLHRERATVVERTNEGGLLLLLILFCVEIIYQFFAKKHCIAFGQKCDRSRKTL